MPRRLECTATGRGRGAARYHGGGNSRQCEVYVAFFLFVLVQKAEIKDSHVVLCGWSALVWPALSHYAERAQTVCFIIDVKAF